MKRTSPTALSGILRREFLRGAGALLASSLLPAAAASERLAPRRLAFRHLHTGERLSVTYAEGGSYLPDALAAVEHVLRDHYSGERHKIEPALLDLLCELQRHTGSRAPFQVVSGYRSPATNDRLAAQGRQVARRSLHMLGMAVDVRLDDVEGRRLRDAALALQGGGVGYYARNDFVHLDVGRVRRWGD